MAARTAHRVTIVGYDRIEYTTDLVVLACASCGAPFGMPRSLQASLRETGDTFYCPSGHQNVYRETEADKLRTRLENATKRADMAEQAARRQRELTEQARLSAAAYKGVATRQRNRIANGMCPCCNRYFPAMREHMETKHPNYRGEPLIEGEKT